MEISDVLIDWSRAQFALTACYHWLFVPLTLGLVLLQGVMETIYYVTKDEFWKRTAQFWMKIFGINFAIGVATGLILEFEFGTNWSNYSWFVGDIFGAPLAVEAIVAFFLEATFIPLMFLGWKKLKPGMHLAATWLGGAGATISAWWILVANSWMQHPVGMAFNPATVRNEMVSFAEVALQPMAVTKFLHTVSSGWMTGAVFVVGVSCWFLLKRRNLELAARSLKVAVCVGILSTLIVMATGDRSGVEIARSQPMKLAAAEGLMDGGEKAPFSIVPGVEVPGMLSFLATHDFTGYVPGINDLLDGYVTPEGKRVPGAEERMALGRQALADLKLYRETMKSDPPRAARAAEALQQNIAHFGYGHIGQKTDLVPPVPLVYWSFRLMVGFGGLLFAILLLLAWHCRGERLASLADRRWVLKAGLWSIPCVYVAGQAGWCVAEVGRQPWIIQDMLPVNAAVSGLPTANVALTFFLFLLIFTALLVAEVKIICSTIKNHKA